MNRFEFKTVMSHLEKETLIQRMADNFAIPNDSMRDILMWLEGELHQYGTKLQGKVLDLTHELDDAKYEIETLHGQIIDRDMEIKELKEDLEELENTLGLRNRSNPDLTIDEEQPKSIFDRWKDCKD